MVNVSGFNQLADASINYVSINNELKVPVMTTSQINTLTGMSEGDIVWDTTAAVPKMYSGTAWEELTTGATGSYVSKTADETVAGNKTITGNTIFTGSSRLGSGYASLSKLSVGNGYTGSGTLGSNQLDFQYSAGGFRHFVNSWHDSNINPQNNRINFFLNNSATDTTSSAPGVGNVLGFSITGSYCRFPLSSNQLIFGPITAQTILNVASNASGYTITLPDAGKNASVVLTESDQTINGVKTFASVNATTLKSNGNNVVDTATTQTIGGNKTFSQPLLAPRFQASPNSVTEKIISMNEAASTYDYYGFGVGSATQVYNAPNTAVHRFYVGSAGNTARTEYMNVSANGTSTTALGVTNTTNQITLGTGNKTTINAVAPTASCTITLPDPGANANIVLTESAQTINGTKKITGNTLFGSTATLTPTSFVSIGGGTDVGELTGTPTQLEFQYFSSGYRHFIKSVHDSNSAAGNKLRFYLNTAVASTTSSTPGTGNALAMTINGSKQLELPGTTNQLLFGTTNTTTVNVAAPSASRTVTLPDPGANANIILSESAQTINGNKTLTGTTTLSVTTLGDTTSMGTGKNLLLSSTSKLGLNSTDLSSYMGFESANNAVRIQGYNNVLLSTGLGGALDGGLTLSSSWGPRVFIGPGGLIGNAKDRLQVSGGINIGSAIGDATGSPGTMQDGTIQYNGTNFQGRKGGAWVNLDDGGSGSSPTFSVVTVQSASPYMMLTNTGNTVNSRLIGSASGNNYFNLPSGGLNTDLMACDGTQTVNGAKTMNALIAGSGTATAGSIRYSGGSLQYYTGSTWATISTAGPMFPTPTRGARIRFESNTGGHNVFNSDGFSATTSWTLSANSIIIPYASAFNFGTTATLGYTSNTSIIYHFQTATDNNNMTIKIFDASGTAVNWNSLAAGNAIVSVVVFGYL